MNFLEMVQRLHLEVGAEGSAPSSVENQSGEAARLVNWVRAADRSVCLLWTRWKFMRKEFSQSVTATVNTVAAPTDLKTWDLVTFRLDGEPILVEHYHDVRDQVIEETDQGQPFRVIVMPKGGLKFEPVPKTSGTVKADYYRTPAQLTTTQSSLIPEEFHDVVIGRAMLSYAGYENAPEIRQAGLELYSEQLARLENDQLPNQDGAQFKGSGGFFQVVAE